MRTLAVAIAFTIAAAPLCAIADAPVTTPAMTQASNLDAPPDGGPPTPAPTPVPGGPVADPRIAQLMADLSALPPTVQADYFSMTPGAFCGAHLSSVAVSTSLKSYCDTNRINIALYNIGHPNPGVCNLGTGMKAASGGIASLLPANSGATRTWGIIGLVVPLIFYGCNNSPTR